MQNTSLKWIFLSCLVILADQLTKYMVVQNLQVYEIYPVFPGLNFTLVNNVGAAFSLLSEAGGWQRWFFVTLSTSVGIGIIIWLARTPDNQKWLACSLSFILGGALGNLVDRVQYGYVIDFLDVYIQRWHWYTFNVADSAITVGAIMLVIDTLWLDRAHVSTRSCSPKKD